MLCLESSTGKAQLFRKQSGKAAAKKDRKIAVLTPDSYTRSTNMAPDWQKFERVVAAIQATQERGATVTWNEVINGRQFDVTVRFKKALYDFLVVIECKDYATAVPAEKLDALVTKARDAHADKAVMVAANGFQSGAKDVAARHNVTILSLASINANDDELAKSLSPVLFLGGVRIEVDAAGPSFIVFPDDPKRMRSVMRHTKIYGPGINKTVEEFIQQNTKQIQKASTSVQQTFSIPLPKGTSIDHPNFPEQRTPVKCILLEHSIITEADLTKLEFWSNDPRFSREILKIENVISGESNFVDLSKVQYGFDTVIEVGKFYTNPNIGNSYYVDSIDDDIVTYYIVESYLFGNLVQARYTQHIKYSTQFVEIKDKAEVERLKLMLDRLRGNE